MVNYWGNQKKKNIPVFSGLIGEIKINPRCKICNILIDYSKKVSIPITIIKTSKQVGFKKIRVGKNVYSGGCIM